MKQDKLDYSVRYEKKKKEQLGMSFGKARNILVNMIFLHLAKKAGMSSCFKCSKEILNAGDISIEHKEPWFDVSPDLFWDLGNIAFSHRKCNIPDRRRGGLPRRKIGEEGTAWCMVCKEFEPVENFHKNKTTWNGLQKHCKRYRPDRNK